MNKIILTILFLIIPCMIFAEDTLSALESETDKTNIDSMDPTPGVVTLSPVFNSNPKRYEKFWEQKGFTEETTPSPEGKYLSVGAAFALTVWRVGE